ncbi:MAG: hypothetical protein P9E24_06490 [Candidatus Competibacter sp.]|nr:hypothetical protein [Candidatus Competibacter sp.]MDG4585007.1 hypothetical protein [Candidatus Competibacter sp.]
MAKAHLSHFARYVDEELRTLCREKRTGTLFIAFANNWLAQIGLSNGEIVALTFQSKHGQEALGLLRGLDVQISISRFAEGQPPIQRAALPPTDLILEQLKVAPGSSGKAAEPVSGRALTDQTKSMLEQELMEFIGPMAAILCEEAWESATDLETALTILSRELPDAKQVTRFRQNILKRLSA